MTIGYLQILHEVTRHRNQVRQALVDGKGYKPLDVEFRVNWKCNFRCKMCGLEDYAQAAPERNRELLSTEDVMRLFDELKQLGCKSITLSGGEPTLRHDLVSVVEYASQKCGFRVYINTNASRAHNEKLDEFVRAGVTGFTFSMDSPLPAIHDEIRLCPGSHQKIVNAMRYLRDGRERGSHNVRVFINCVVMKQNIATLDAFIHLYKQVPFDNLNFVPASINTTWDEWTAQDKGLRASVEEAWHFKKIIMPRFAAADWPLVVKDPFGDTDDEIERNLHVEFAGNEAPCYAPFVHTVVQNNGDLIPCCYAPDSFRVGNVKELGFAAVWESEGYNQIRADLKKHLYPMCASCRQYRIMNKHIKSVVDKKDEPYDNI